MIILGVIPARLHSSRLPRKVLREIRGVPMVVQVFRQVRTSPLLSDVLVATDSEEVVEVCHAHHVPAVMTRANHASGTDRLWEVSRPRSADVYVNIQGDEPLIDPGTIDAVVAEMLEDDSIQIATPCTAITQGNDVMEPNIVKVVRDFDGNCLYFSRAPIPWVRDTKAAAAPHHWKHVGLYAFRREALLEFPTLPPGELEAVEQLEQLRWLENGFRIRGVETDYDAISVDVPADIQRVEKILQERAAS